MRRGILGVWILGFRVWTFGFRVLGYIGGNIGDMLGIYIYIYVKITENKMETTMLGLEFRIWGVAFRVQALRFRL